MSTRRNAVVRALSALFCAGAGTVVKAQEPTTSTIHEGGSTFTIKNRVPVQSTSFNLTLAEDAALIINVGNRSYKLTGKEIMDVLEGKE